MKLRFISKLLTYLNSEQTLVIRVILVNPIPILMKKESIEKSTQAISNGWIL